MTTIKPTDSERRDGVLSPESLEIALNAIRMDGFVVLDRVVDPAHVAAIRDAMLEDARIKIERGESKNGHIAQHPPRRRDLLFEDVISNSFGLQISEALIGPAITLGFYESNTNLPGSPGQEVHTDMKPREASDSTDHTTDVMVLNVPLIDFTIENGATEVWPGTHLVPTEIGTRWVTDEIQADRQRVRPKEQAVMAAGSLLLRDIRLWHRGVPNRSGDIRTMIAMIINGRFDSDRGDRSKIAVMATFPESSRSFFEGLRVCTNPIYIADDQFAEE